jgi:Tat protein translocase TatB subunit
MFGIGFTELLLVLVVALLVLGPDKLPEVARSMAKAYNELRRTGHDLKRTVEGLDISGTIARTVEKSGARAADKSDDKAARAPEPEKSSETDKSPGPDESQAPDKDTPTAKTRETDSVNTGAGDAPGKAT